MSSVFGRERHLLGPPPRVPDSLFSRPVHDSFYNPVIILHLHSALITRDFLQCVFTQLDSPEMNDLVLSGFCSIAAVFIRR